MKRIFLLVLMLCLFCINAYAGPKLYRHPSYDFSNLRNVCVLVDRQISERVHLLQSVQDSLKMGGKE